ncbi:MAG: hypothetical protein M1132_04665, partial [Chloroflexi bacterium]|nr:hypothetical protein [Chloroflexota bacterium]
RVGPMAGGAMGDSAGAGAPLGEARRVPQFEQKAAPIGLSIPQPGHKTPAGGCKRVPQLLQNLLPSRFWVPH